MNKQNLRYLQAAEEHPELCTLISMEECGELIQAVSKAKRGKINKNNLTEEIADVFICLHWLQKIYDIKGKEVHKWIDIKTDRILDRLGKCEFK